MYIKKKTDFFKWLIMIVPTLVPKYTQAEKLDHKIQDILSI